MDTVNYKRMDKGLPNVKKVGFVRIRNITDDVYSSGSGIGQARNYEITLLRRLELSPDFLTNCWVSQSYDNAVFHDKVPKLVRSIFNLPDFHVAIRDQNHCVNIAVEHSYKSDGCWRTLFRSISYIINATSHGSNLVLEIKEHCRLHGLKFVSLKTWAETKWTQHQNGFDIFP